MVNRIFVALIVLLFLPGVYLTLADLIPAPHQEDFGAYYVAARAMSTGDSPYDPIAAARLAEASGVAQYSPYIYPPLLALMLRPLAALPYSAAAAIWFVMSAAALLAALWLLRPVAGLPWRTYRWLMAAAFFLPPVHHTLQHGQINHVLLLLVAGGAVGGAGSAAWVGLAAALKVFPATLGGAYISSGRITALAMAIAGGAFTTLAAWFVAPAASLEFVARVLPQLAADRRLAPNNQSIYAVMARWFEPLPFVTPIVDAPDAGRLAASAIALAVVAITIRALVVVRMVKGEMIDISRLSLVLAATLIVSPLTWDHYYVLLLLPAAGLYRSSSDDRSVRTLWLAGVVLLLSHRYWPLMFAMKSPLFMSSGVAGVIVLWVALLKALSYDRVCAVKPRPSDTSLSAI